MERRKCNLHFGGSGELCNSCTPFLGFRLAVVVIAGVLIGMAGLSVVEKPPAAVLISENQAATNKIVLDKLHVIEAMLLDLRDDVVDIKENVNNSRK